MTIYNRGWVSGVDETVLIPNSEYAPVALAHYRLRVPQGTAGPIALTARLQYRKFSRYYTQFAYAGWSYVVARLGPARAGVTLHLMPAFGVLLSAVFLHEYPAWFHFVGIALILAGVAMSAFRKPALAP